MARRRVDGSIIINDRQRRAATNRELAEIVRRQQPVMMPATATVQDACKQMDERRVGAVLVTDRHAHLVGIFTGRDVVRTLAKGKDVANTRLRDVMTRAPQSMPSRATAIEALRLMRDGGFRHVPVVDEGVVVGIVSRSDVRGLEQDRLDEETGIWDRMRSSPRLVHLCRERPRSGATWRWGGGMTRSPPCAMRRHCSPEAPGPHGQRALSSTRLAPGAEATWPFRLPLPSLSASAPEQICHAAHSLQQQSRHRQRVGGRVDRATTHRQGFRLDFARPEPRCHQAQHERNHRVAPGQRPRRAERCPADAGL